MNFDEDRVGDTLEKVLKLLTKKKLSIRELIVFYGNLGYYIGASIAGFKSKGPSIDELKKHYYSNPTVDVGLMIQGLMITDWEKGFVEKPKISNLAQFENKTETKKEKSSLINKILNRRKK